MARRNRDHHIVEVEVAVETEVEVVEIEDMVTTLQREKRRRLTEPTLARSSVSNHKKMSLRVVTKMIKTITPTLLTKSIHAVESKERVLQEVARKISHFQV
jgi:hypothetical protein